MGKRRNNAITTPKQFFTNVELNDVIRNIVCRSRVAKDNVPIFRETGNGCILIVARPLCWQADVWLGNLGSYDTDGNELDVHEYAFVRTIAPGGSHTIRWHDPEDGHEEPVNCLAYAMMKVTYLARLVKLGITSDQDEEANQTGYFCEANGFARHKGAVCTTVYLGNKPLMRLYICFSGASEDDDLACAEDVTIDMRKYLQAYCDQLAFKSWKNDGELP